MPSVDYFMDLILLEKKRKWLLVCIEQLKNVVCVFLSKPVAFLFSLRVKT